MSKGKNNIFFYSPGGYGPCETPSLGADHIEYDGDEEDWYDAAWGYYDAQLRDTDYGCFFFSREDAQKLFDTLKELLEE